VTSPPVHHLTESLSLVDLDLPRTGFRQFISSWVYRSGGVTILVDPGPHAAHPALLAALKSLNIDQIDTVLLTHIHIDHAGGAGLLLHDYPDTRFFCHPKSFRHLSQPARLWEESRKVLRDLADDYGEIAPIPEGALFFRESLSINGLEIHAIETPGHAPHHLCFMIGDLLFAGEVAGVNYPLPKGFYLRPATPPIFHRDVFLASLQKAARLPASRICLGHYGCISNPDLLFSSAMKQLEHWLDVVERHRLAPTEEAEEIIFGKILKSDPRLAEYHSLPEDIQAREKFFCLNAIRGMRQYLSTP